MRGKVDSFLAADAEAPAATRRQAASTGARLLQSGSRLSLPAVLVLTCGLMGTGKSTLGAALAGTLGAILLRSDELRKELAGELGGSGRTAAFGQGIYAPNFSRAHLRPAAAADPGDSGRRGYRHGRCLIRPAGRSGSASGRRRPKAGCPAASSHRMRPADRPGAARCPPGGRRRPFGWPAGTVRPAGGRLSSLSVPEESAIRVDTRREVDYNVTSSSLRNH